MSEHHPGDTYGEKIEKLMTMTVAAAKGLVPLGQVALPITQIANGDLAPPEARDFARALSRILKGERDPIALAEELTPEFAEAIWEILEQIEEPLPEIDDSDREDITFKQLVEMVADACSGDIMLWQRLWNFTEALAKDERLAPDIRALGTVLRKILAGERQKHVLDDLSSEHRWAVEELLDWLNKRVVEPGETEEAPFDERSALQEELAAHHRNLHKLKLQAIKYGPADIPLRLSNQIEEEEAIIQTLEKRLGILS